MFADVQPGPKDPMFDLKKLADDDISPRKIDLGVGVYRNEEGGYHELQAIKKVCIRSPRIPSIFYLTYYIDQAKKILNETNPGHDVSCHISTVPRYTDCDGSDITTV